VSEPLRVRRLREQLAAVSQYVTDLYMPIHEGYRDAPLIVEDCFDSVLGTLDEFDLQLAQLDGGSAVGGEMELQEKWRDSGQTA
jgi:hypothetical protein